MKVVSSNELTEAYQKLYPQEFRTDSSFQEIEEILNNWLTTYKKSPEDKIAMSNWSGKVTKALFLALEIKFPKTKAEALKILTQ